MSVFGGGYQAAPPMMAPGQGMPVVPLDLDNVGDESYYFRKDGFKSRRPRNITPPGSTAEEFAKDLRNFKQEKEDFKKDRRIRLMDRMASISMANQARNMQMQQGSMQQTPQPGAGGSMQTSHQFRGQPGGGDMQSQSTQPFGDGGGQSTMGLQSPLMDEKYRTKEERKKLKEREGCILC